MQILHLIPFRTGGHPSVRSTEDDGFGFVPIESVTDERAAWLLRGCSANWLLRHSEKIKQRFGILLRIGLGAVPGVQGMPLPPQSPLAASLPHSPHDAPRHALGKLTLFLTLCSVIRSQTPFLSGIATRFRNQRF